jgi:hypothetical protein
MTNYLFERDALQMLHTHLEGDASAVIAVLDPDHLTTYLRWLMRWGMTDESRMVWQAATDAGQPDRKIALDYAHFLLGRKHIEQSRGIWERYTGITGLTNAGFEAKITGKAFDWRHWGEQDGFWALDRVKGRPPEGQYALKIVFKGRENLAFHHLYQILTVAPEEDYRLTYAWKSNGLTTDQRPYIEIMSYDAEGLYQPGPMMDRSQKWQTDFVEFKVPVGCQAVLVRLRRRPSHRFDSKIRGTVWLDDFRLEKLPTGVAPSNGGHQSNH